jgi:CBS domain containing-hemolysin-like protein
MSTLKAIDSLFTNKIREIQRPSTIVDLSLCSPAMDILTDFTRQQPMMLEQNTSVDQAREIMRRTHAKTFLVIDAEESFRGVISLDDLESEKVLTRMCLSRLRRDELSVEFVMTPRSRLHAIDFKKLQTATVGDVLAWMKEYGEHHMIVVETHSDSIRGVVSAYTIARKMHTPLVINERAVLFSDIFTAIAV